MHLTWKNVLKNNKLSHSNSAADNGARMANLSLFWTTTCLKPFGLGGFPYSWLQALLLDPAREATAPYPNGSSSRATIYHIAGSKPPNFHLPVSPVDNNRRRKTCEFGIFKDRHGYVMEMFGDSPWFRVAVVWGPEPPGSTVSPYPERTLYVCELLYTSHRRNTHLWTKTRDIDEQSMTLATGATSETSHDILLVVLLFTPTEC